jgi:hypothetical protein
MTDSLSGFVNLLVGQNAGKSQDLSGSEIVH